MRNIENIFLNTKKYLLKETQSAVLVKAPEIPWFNKPIGIWFSKRFVYKGKYENSSNFIDKYWQGKKPLLNIGICKNTILLKT